MPQLDPSPWFAIFFFSWVIFLTVLPPKILSHLFPNEPSPKDSKALHTDSWNWPWH